MSDAKIDIHIEPVVRDGAVPARITIDQSLFGHEAVFKLEVLTVVHDSRPVNESKVLFEHQFRIAGDRYEFLIPAESFRSYSYKGEKISIEVHARVVVDDGFFSDTTVGEEVECALGTKPAINTDAQGLTSPQDAFNFAANLRAISPARRAIVMGLVAVGAVFVAINSAVGVHDQFVPEHQTYFYSHTNSDGESQSPLFGSTAVSGISGGAIWLLIRVQLRKYIRIRLKPMPREITRGMHFSVAEFVEGRPRVPLEDITIRIVACNFEKGQYKRGSGTKERTVSFSEPCRAVILFEKKIALVRAREAIEAQLHEAFSFDPMFAALYPPNETSSSHGLAVHWELQLLHPLYVDHELVGPCECFRYEDFLEA